MVLMLDEVDALVGDTLISLLRQVRSGYDKRPAQFPQTIILCGVRDVRDYRIHSGTDRAIITGGSAFNIKARSLRLGDLKQAEIEALYHQHTAETGQSFEPAVFTAVWDLTRGQPWLVNALGYETCFEMKEHRDRSRPITAEMIFAAKEELILRRETHLDQLSDKLQEERVRRVIEPTLPQDPRRRAGRQRLLDDGADGPGKTDMGAQGERSVDLPSQPSLALAESRMVRSGALPAAALALLVDGVLALAERLVAPAHRRARA